MYSCPSYDIQSVDDFKLNTIDLHINRLCNMACKYCYLIGGFNTNSDTSTFTRWNDLIEMLKYINIDNDKLTINFSTGELFTSTRMPTLYNAIKKIDKINRYRAIDIEYRCFSNGTSYENIKDFMNKMFGRNITLSISYDGENSSRLYKNDSDSTLETLKSLARINCADEVIIRSAAHENIRDLSNTIINLYNLGYKNLEYYLVDDWQGYRDPEYIKLFKEEVYKLLTFFKDKGDCLYNIHKYKTRVAPTTSCVAGKTLSIDTNGRISVCSTSLNPKLGLEDISVDITEWKRIPEVFNKFKNITLDRSNLDCATCNNILCEDCCSHKAISKNYQDRLYQQCNIRHAELEVYKSIFG